MEENLMKKYIRPTVSVVELQAKEIIAANPLDVAVVSGGDGTGASTLTTTYDLTLFGGGSNL